MTEEKLGKDRNRKVSIERDQELRDIQAVMSTREGRRFLNRVLDKAAVMRCSFTGNANQTAFNEGQRNIGLFITGEIMEECGDLYLLMLREAKDAEAR